MKLLATVISVLLTTSITAALRGNKDTHDDAVAIEKDNGVISTIDVTEELFDDGYSRQLQSRNLKSEGIFNTLVVRVVDDTGSQTSISQFEMYNRFYIYEDSFKRILEGCSYGKEGVEQAFEGPFLPTDGVYQPLPGIIQMTIDETVAGEEVDVIRNSVRDKMEVVYGEDYLDTFDLVVYCLPTGSLAKGSNGWKWNFESKREDVLMNDGYCGDIRAMMLYAGSHMGLENFVKERTGHMGPYKPAYNKNPMKCYNAAYSYQLDWYTNQSVSVLDILNNDQRFKLDGIAFHTVSDGIVSLRIENNDGDDYYLGYNLKSGINSDTDYEPNKVHLLKKKNGPYETGLSTVIATLEPRVKIGGFYINNPKHTFRVGSSAVTLATDVISALLSVWIDLSARSLIDTIDVSTLISIGSKTFYLGDDSNGDYVGDGLIKVIIKDEVNIGGSDWYIQTAEENLKVQLIERTNGSDEEGESNVVTTLGQNEEHEWSVGSRLVTMKLNYFDGNNPNPSAPYSITLSAKDDPSSTPSAGPTPAPTSTPSAGPTPAPTSTPTSKPIDCADDSTIEFQLELEDGNTETKTCAYVASETKIKKRKDFCKTKVEVNGKSKKISTFCKETCGMVGKGECVHLTSEPTSSPTSAPSFVLSEPTYFPTSAPGAGLTNEPTPAPSSTPTLDCDDHPTKVFNIDVDGTVKTKDCAWVASKKKAKRKEYCKMKVDVNGNNKKLPTICKETCGMVGKGVCKHLNSASWNESRTMWFMFLFSLFLE